MSIKQELLDKMVWAVVGATDKTDRYGYKIFKKLKEHDYTTYGIHPKLEELDGDKIYKNLTDLPEKIDVVDMVVGPNIAIGVLEEAKELGIEYIFFQPGSYNEEVIKKAEELGLKYLEDDCIYATLINME